MKKISVLPLGLILILFTWSCKKGDQGPIGPAGLAGPTGAVGAPNVIYSDWFQATPWIKDTIFNVFGFSYTKADAQITQSIIDSGSVLTFGKMVGYNPLVWPADQVAQLPIIINYKNSSAGAINTDTWSALVRPGNLKIRFVNDQNYYNSINDSHKFRYIIIPGGVKDVSGSSIAIKQNGGIETNTAGVALKNGSIDFKNMSYEQVCNYFHIPE